MNNFDSGEEFTENTGLMSGEQLGRGYEDGSETSESRRQRQAQSAMEDGGDPPGSQLESGFENTRNQERVSKGFDLAQLMLFCLSIVYFLVRFVLGINIENLVDTRSI